MRMNRDAVLNWLAAHSSWSTGRALPEGWTWIGREASDGGILSITEDDWIAERVKRRQEIRQHRKEEAENGTI